MAGRTSYYGGIVLDGLVFHIDAAKQESYAKRGIRYMQTGNSNLFLDFADTSKNPSTANATGAIINGVTFSNFAPYHLSDSTKPEYWHNPALSAWRDSAGIGTFYGNLEFDGVNDYVSFGSTPDMNGIKDITVSAWFYVNKFKSGAVPTGGTTSIIASRYNGVNGWALGYNNQGVVYFDGRESGAEYLSVTASIILKSSNSTANGGWYNAVGTKQGNVWNIYVAETNRYVVDGDRNVYVGPGQQSLLGTRTMGVGTTTFTTNNLYLGCVFDTPTLHMDGRLMSLSVYNRALSLAEINQNYDSFAKRIISSTVPDPEFITVWDTSIDIGGNMTSPTAARTIVIGIDPSKTYNYTVNWGDGNTTTGHTGEETHIYAVDGIYTVKITGTYPAIKPMVPITNSSIPPYYKRMIEVKNWGTNVWETMAGAFKDCINMNVTATDSPNLSLVTDMSEMFYGCEKMNGNIGNWNTSTVQNMSGLFKLCLVFNQPLNWNTISVTYMGNMFFGAELFNQNISSWNTFNVQDMSSMFRGASDFNNGGQAMLTSGNSWNTSNVTNMGSMFQNATSFNQNISNWNTLAVMYMNYMFNDALVFNNGEQTMLTNGNSWNTSNVQSMNNMFKNAQSFNQNIGNWNTALVTNMGEMFHGASVFNQNIATWNTLAVQNMNMMFRYAVSFNNGGVAMLRNGSSWNTQNVAYMSEMFAQAEVFNADISNWNVSLVRDMSFMFNNSYLFNRNIGGWNTISVLSMRGMFYNAFVFNQNIATWNTSNVQDMKMMFANAIAFNNNGVAMLTSGSSWNTSNVIDMGYMFMGADVFNQNIANWNTASVTDMSYMFYDSTNFNQNIGGWNISSVGDFTDFMYTKTPTTFSTTNLNAIYNGWSTQPVIQGRIISFGSAKYTSAATAGRNILTGSPRLWQITDGGI